MTEFRKLEQYFREFPKGARQATSIMLNNLGFAARQEMPDVLRDHGFIVRNPKFTVSRMRVQKTTAKPIQDQRVIIGSVETKGKGGSITHDGWRSLQTGRPTPKDRNRVTTLLSRGGDKANKVRAKSRLKPAIDYPNPGAFDDARGRTIGNRIQAMIREVASGMYDTGKMFVLPKGQSGRMSPGLYKVVRGKKSIRGKVYPKIQIVQRFDRPPHARRYAWIQELIKRTLQRTDYRAAWSDAMQRVEDRAKHNS